jgi:hypothetical protein
MTDRTRIAAIGAAGWAGRQVPMVGLRSLIRVGSSLGHTAFGKRRKPRRSAAQQTSKAVRSYDGFVEGPTCAR